jgi:hypothetical protein
MKGKQHLFTSFVVLLIVALFTLAGCDTGTDGTGNGGDGKTTIIIKNIGINNVIGVMVKYNPDSGTTYLVGSAGGPDTSKTVNPSRVLTISGLDAPKNGSTNNFTVTVYFTTSWTAAYTWPNTTTDLPATLTLVYSYGGPSGDHLLTREPGE